VSARPTLRPHPRHRIALAKMAGLLLVPALLLAVCFVIRDARGPYWMGLNLDPDYAYLLNSLNLVQGHPPAHVDHPGTFVQLMGAAALRAGHAAVGRGSIAEDVIGRPELYLTLTSALYVTMYAGLLVVLGAAVLQATGSVPAAVLSQATPFLSPTCTEHILCVKPEPVLLSLSAIAAILALRARRGPAGRAGTALALGAVGGAALASKVTAAPLLVVPLLALAGWRARAVFAATAAATAAVLVFPARAHLVNFWLLQRRIALHGGQYGTGAERGVHPGQYLMSAASLLRHEPALALLIVAGTVVLLRVRVVDERGAGMRRVLLGIVGAATASVLLVAGHPAAHYLVPALGFLGLGYALTVSLPFAEGTPGARYRLAVVGWGVVAALAVSQSVPLLQLLRELRQKREQQAAAVTVVGSQPGALVVHYYRASHPAYALHFGDAFAGMRRMREIAEMYPRSLFYDIWENHLEADRPWRSPAVGEAYLLHGSPLTAAEVGRLSLPTQGRVEAIFWNDVEAVYRVLPPPRSQAGTVPLGTAGR
jgi:hypothetical protein